jgi:hypothetical protein
VLLRQSSDRHHRRHQRLVRDGVRVHRRWSEARVRHPPCRFYSLAATDLVVDINGWIAAGSGFHGVDPARVLDTRPGQSANAIRDVPKSKIGGGSVLVVQVTNLRGAVPASGVSAVSLNVTATNTEAAGFITVFDCGTMEEVSSLNFDAGATVANAVLAPVSAAGTICLYANQRTDVIVDINGWIAK